MGFWKVLLTMVGVTAVWLVWESLFSDGGSDWQQDQPGQETEPAETQKQNILAARPSRVASWIGWDNFSKDIADFRDFCSLVAGVIAVGLLGGAYIIFIVLLVALAIVTLVVGVAIVVWAFQVVFG